MKKESTVLNCQSETWIKMMTKTSNAEDAPGQFKKQAVLTNSGIADFDNDNDTVQKGTEIQKEFREGIRTSVRQKAKLNYKDIQAGKVYPSPEYK